MKQRQPKASRRFILHPSILSLTSRLAARTSMAHLKSTNYLLGLVGAIGGGCWATLIFFLPGPRGLLRNDSSGALSASAAVRWASVERAGIGLLRAGLWTGHLHRMAVRPVQRRRQLFILCRPLARPDANSADLDGRRRILRLLVRPRPPRRSLAEEEKEAEGLPRGARC